MSWKPQVPRLVGRYELHSELAQGGMATVYLGRLLGDHGFAKCVAIKRLHEHLANDTELVTLLLEEARITERIRHPNVVATLDVVSADGELLLVMEYVHGETLAKLVRASVETGTRCPPAVAASIIHGVLLGMQAAHETTDVAGQPLHIVHRDISPQNVIVGTDGVARLLDFGIAKAVGSIAHTRTGEVKGKVPYMAPEILRFEPASPQTDLWACGVVLWETLCARRLFRGESEINVWGQVLTASIPTPSDVLGAPTPLDAVVMRALSRDPARRYANGGEMAADLRAAIPLASPAEVSAWVSQMASGTLTKRTQLLRAVETGAPAPITAGKAWGSDTTGPPRPAGQSGSVGIVTTTREGKPPRGSRVPWFLTAVLAVFVVILLVVAAKRRPSPPVGTAAAEPSAASSSAPPPLAGSTAASAATVASVTTLSSAPALMTAPPPPQTGAPTATTSAPRHGTVKFGAKPAKSAAPKATEPGPPPTAHPRPECDPPTYVDENGHTKFKVQCM